MLEKIEHAALYAAGGSVALILCIVALSLRLPFVLNHSSYFLLFFTTTTGTLLSVVIAQYKKQRLFKKNNRARDEAVALIAHEMRTALTSTGWALQAMLDTYKDTLSAADKDMVANVLDSIHATVARTVELLETSLTDIERLSISLQWQTLAQVEAMLKETVQKYVVGTKDKGVNIICQITLDGVRQVEVDMVRLRIVLENLLENALQYIGEGKKEIVVTIKNNSTTLFVDIADSGLGIPKKEQAKIFSQFFRASNARKRLSTGSGIGLYLSAQFIKAHRGTITFESTEGSGTTFHITIPLKTAADTHEFLSQV